MEGILIVTEDVIIFIEEFLVFIDRVNHWETVLIIVLFND